jgi:hypothetical protein
MADEFIVKIRADAELQQLNQTAERLKLAKDAADGAGKSTQEFSRQLRDVQDAASTRALQLYREHLEQLIDTEERAGRETSELRRELEALSRTKTAGVTDALSRGAQDLVSTLPGLRAVSGALNGAFPLIAGGFAGATIALNTFQQKVRESVALGTELQNLSDRFNVNAESLQLLGNAAETYGSNIQTVGIALNDITRTSQEAIKGNEDLQRRYEKFNITLEDLRRLSPEQLFLRVSDAVASGDDRNRAYADTLAIMGESAGQLFKTLEQGSKTIKEIGEQRGILTEDEVLRLKDANEALEKLDRQLTVWAGGKVSDVSRGFEYLTNAPLTSLVTVLREANPIFKSLITDDMLRDVSRASGEFRKVQASLLDTGQAAAGAAQDMEPLKDPTLAEVGLNIARSFDAVATSAKAAAGAVRDQTAAIREAQRQQDELDDADMALELADIDASSASEPDKIRARQAVRARYSERKFQRDQQAGREEIEAMQTGIREDQSGTRQLRQRFQELQDMLAASEQMSPEDRQRLLMPDPAQLRKELYGDDGRSDGQGGMEEQVNQRTALTADRTYQTLDAIARLRQQLEHNARLHAKQNQLTEKQNQSEQATGEQRQAVDALKLLIEKARAAGDDTSAQEKQLIDLQLGANPTPLQLQQAEFEKTQVDRRREEQLQKQRAASTSQVIDRAAEINQADIQAAGIQGGEKAGDAIRIAMEELGLTMADVIIPELYEGIQKMKDRLKTEMKEWVRSQNN